MISTEHDKHFSFTSLQQVKTEYEIELSPDLPSSYSHEYCKKIILLHQMHSYSDAYYFWKKKLSHCDCMLQKRKAQLKACANYFNKLDEFDNIIISQIDNSYHQWKQYYKYCLSEYAVIKNRYFKAQKHYSNFMNKDFYKMKNRMTFNEFNAIKERELIGSTKGFETWVINNLGEDLQRRYKEQSINFILTYLACRTYNYWDKHFKVFKAGKVVEKKNDKKRS